MIDNRFYEGFEGETEISFVANDNRLIIWNGYFETILNILLDCKLEKQGILKEYFNVEGWYDDSPWLVDDVPFTVSQLKNFDITKVRQASIKDDLEKVVKTIISFLEDNASSKIYIEYE
ncbi:hypothetical protein [uncultured Enterococcus sp.]|uniref:hypothetical protein n=1 Tax=uncultured Enterococcus sp. TaxID=167972 RepID=UPI002AA62526|nr:hypothetical protein [uncultured Enterococcus sp.]